MIVTVITVEIHIQYQHEVVDTIAVNASLKDLVESNVHILGKQKAFYFSVMNASIKLIQTDPELFISIVDIKG